MPTEELKVETKKRRSKGGKPSCLNCYTIRKMDADWELVSQSSSPGSEDGENNNVGIGAAPSRRSSFSYHRMPDPSLNLSVLKLDNTSFEVKIAMTATVSELKTAVEDVFRDHTEEDGGSISWNHVWSNFCLCYEDYKLVDDRAYLKDYGIKDGDQLQFIRHLSVKTSPIKKQPQNHDAIVELNVMRLAGPEDPTELEGDNHTNKNDDSSSGSSPDEESTFFHDNNKKDTENTVVARTEFRIVHLLRTWLSYSKMVSPHKSPRTPKPGKYF